MAPSLIRYLARRPQVFDWLRFVLEGGYVGHSKIIRRELSRESWRVLDVGCGTGIYASHFPPAEYHGIDISPEYIAAAARKFPHHQFSVMDATAMTFGDHTFESAFISGVLHHLNDEQAVAVLQNVCRVIRPGGKLVIWEDIPAPAWNLVGHIIHRLDLGSHIRQPDGYRKLIETVSPVHTHQTMRSGFMDYGIFVSTILAK